MAAVLPCVPLFGSGDYTRGCAPPFIGRAVQMSKCLKGEPPLDRENALYAAPHLSYVLRRPET